MPRVEIEPMRCKGCKLCVSACPKNVLDIGTNTNARGYRYVQVVKEDDCIGCRFCGLTCPDAALTVFK